ncbi:MAG: hypothetical protein ACRETQ_07270 [Gammaproteobacteria bacterium]
MAVPSALDNTGTGPVPLVIGVTGHRDLVQQDLPRMREALKVFFACLHRQYPHTPLRLLSPLAEGADRLVAQLALEHGAELVVPLPMPEQEYRKDFPHSLAEFDALKAQATITYTLPEPAGTTERGTDFSGSRRDACYEQVGVHIVKHAQLIVALWDGVASADRGGTAHIVRHAMSGATDTASANLAQSFGPAKAIWHLRIPRVNGSNDQRVEAIAPYHTASWRFSDNRNQERPFNAAAGHWPGKEFGHLQSLEIFNRDASALAPQRVQESVEALLPAGVSGKLLDPSERITHAFVAADLISAKYNKMAYKLWKWIFVLAGVMILGFQSYVHLWSHSLLLLLYPAAFIAMTVAYSILHRRRLDDRFIDARILAEALRVTIYWRLAGIRARAVDQYLGRHMGAIGWTPAAVLGLLTLPPPDAEFAQRNGLSIADQFWIAQQLKYYQRQSLRQGKRVNLYRRFAGSLYALTLVVSIGIAIYGAVVTRPSVLRAILILLMASGPPVAVLWIAYAEKQGWERHVKEYTRNAALFAHAHEQIVNFTSSQSSAVFPHIQAVVLELGREALWENAEWAVLHRVKPPALPLG